MPRRLAVLALFPSLIACGQGGTGPHLFRAMDAATGDTSDAAADVSDLGAGADDLAAATTDMPAANVDLASGGTGAVGPHGGTVDRLFFALHGDTRGPNCDDPSTYPSDIIKGVYAREAALGVEFAVDLGDHMNACGVVAGEAQTEMGLYTAASSMLGKPTFMTMGNHECSVKGTCTAGDPNYDAFVAALAPISSLPYYTFDVRTSTGLATFVVIADNAWDQTEATWLDATLAKADTAAKYTIITRHHPIDYAKLSAPDEWNIIQKHKYTLFLVSHSHQYLRDMANDPSGRTVIMGCGGAPLASGQTYYGFATVKQQPDDTLAVTVYDEASGAAQDSFTVTPQ